MIKGYLFMEDLESKYAPRPPSYRGTLTGYGKDIPTHQMVRINKRWRRVYYTVYSNAGTRYIKDKDGWIVIR